MKRCPCCGKTKPLDEFYRARNRPDGRSSQCASCDRERRRQYVAANAGAQREASRRYRAQNPAKVRAGRRRHYAANAEALRADARHRTRERAIRDRETVYDHYGRVCACCGSTERLSIDHVNGDGGAHRAEIGTGSAAMCRWLVANGFPEGFQTLCMPCNQSKRNGEQCRLDHVKDGGETAA